MHELYRVTASALLGAGALTALSCNSDFTDGDLSVLNGRHFTAQSCKPTSPACYVAGKDGPGNECMAMRDNENPSSNPGHIQMRWTWSSNVRPVGLFNNSLVSKFLDAATRFDEPDCKSPGGTTGYMLVMDWVTDKDHPENEKSTLGYADAVPSAKLADAVRDGLCMTEFWFNANGPNNDEAKVPHARWHVEPTVAKRVLQDFDVKIVRGGPPIFFYQDDFRAPDAHLVHGYSPTTYIVTNVSQGAPNGLTVIPIYDAELTITANDPSHNCAGRFRSDALDPKTSCASDDPHNPAWGCSLEHEQSGVCEPGQGDAKVEGYFLISDLEKVTDLVYPTTLCAEYVGGSAAAAAAGWTAPDKTYCSSSPLWGTGTPKPDADHAGDPLQSGDWCSVDNSPARPGCADAWKAVTYFALQGFPVQLEGDKPRHCTPKVCQPANARCAPP